MFVFAGLILLATLVYHVVLVVTRIFFNAGYYVARSLYDAAGSRLPDPATTAGPSANLASVLSLSVTVTHSVGRNTTSRRVNTLVRFHHGANQNTEAGGRNLQVDA